MIYKALKHTKAGFWGKIRQSDLSIIKGTVPKLFKSTENVPSLKEHFGIDVPDDYNLVDVEVNEVVKTPITEELFLAEFGDCTITINGLYNIQAAGNSAILERTVWFPYATEVIGEPMKTIEEVRQLYKILKRKEFEK